MNNTRVFFVLVMWAIWLFCYSDYLLGKFPGGSALGLCMGLTIIAIIDYFDERAKNGNS